MRPPVYHMLDFYAYQKNVPNFRGAFGWDFSSIMMHDIGIYTTFYKDLYFTRYLSSIF